MSADRMVSEMFARLAGDTMNTVFAYKDEQTEMARQLEAEVNELQWELGKAKEIEDFLNSEKGKLAGKVEELEKELAAKTTDADMYRRWWSQEMSKNGKLEKELEGLKKKTLPEYESKSA